MYFKLSVGENTFCKCVCNGVVNITAIQNCNDCGVIDFCIPNGCETSLDDPEELFYAQCFGNVVLFNLFQFQFQFNFNLISYINSS